MTQKLTVEDNFRFLQSENENLRNEVQAYLDEQEQKFEQDAGTEEQIAKLTEFNEILQGFND